MLYYSTIVLCACLTNVVLVLWPVLVSCLRENKYVGYSTLNEFIIVEKIRSPLSSSHNYDSNMLIVHEALWALATAEQSSWPKW